MESNVTPIRRRGRGRPLTADGHLDAAALDLIDVRCALQATIVLVADWLRDADQHLRDARQKAA